MASFIIFVTTLMALLTQTMAANINTQATNTNQETNSIPTQLSLVSGLLRQRRFVLGESANTQGWSEWKNSSECSVTCGEGVVQQTRTCLSGTTQCNGSVSRSVSCNVKPCPEWTTWGPFSPCSGRCGQVGTQHRVRDCNTGNRRDCEVISYFSYYEVEACHGGPCDEPVWSDWSSWSPCSLTCGNGVCWRTRQCYHGKISDCIGNNTDITSCYVTSCNKQVGTDGHVTDGSWSAWEAWSPCSATCGTGVQHRTRDCTDPTHSKNGANCTGENTSFKMCSINCVDISNHNITMDGSWSAWESWSPCSVSCGTGVQYRTRDCTDPAPSKNGANCTGDYMSFQMCRNNCTHKSNALTMDGSWSAWEAWSQCSVSCGNGVQHRTRDCTDPAPSKDGANCTGDYMSFQMCRNICTKNLNHWSEWENRTQCSTSCGIGIYTQIRKCSSGNDSECAGNTSRILPCVLPDCPDWSEWENKTQCSTSCGIGIYTQIRKCNSGNDSECAGNTSRILPCILPDCPVSTWLDWSAWSTCSRSCGHGERTRSRDCSHAATPGGNPGCIGETTETNTCTEMADCPVVTVVYYGLFRDVWWGKQHRLRHCSSGHDVDCPGPAMDMAACNTQAC